MVTASGFGLKRDRKVREGLYFTLPDRKVWIYDKYKQHFLDNVMTAFNKLLKVAKNLGMTLCY
jgi:hypothetical protein